jgi:uncharacterized protein YjbJ (UPF0337 family)
MISRFRMRSLATNLLYPLTHNSLMSHEEEKGKTKQVKGKIHEAAGVLTDNKEQQNKGRLEKTEGKAQEEVGKLKRKIKEDL